MLEKISELIDRMETELALLAVDPEERNRLQDEYEFLLEQQEILMASENA